MASKRIGCLPVLEDDELVGMITETDILRWVARSAG
jgi:CBS domain-containing protein